MAVIGNHLIAAFHTADRCFDHSTAGIAEGIARAQVRLLANKALTMDFLHIAIGIIDNPVTCE